jgi:hypothetical protein
LTNALAKDFLTLKEACEWANSYLGRQVTLNNISYLIQYAKIHAYDQEGNPKKGSNGETRVSLQELKQYYDRSWKEEHWKKVLGKDINWNLSFDNLREAERTKHVHRLHPYKGKFIPQLVEYFLDDHVNDFKKTVFFQQGDIVLDPFVGSGTTLVQCLELGLHSIGVDISEFNCMISKVKTEEYDLEKLSKRLRKAAHATEDFSQTKFWYERETEMDGLLSSFNEKYYPNPDFKFLVRLIREFEDKVAEEASSLLGSDRKTTRKTIEETLSKHKDEKAALEGQVEGFAGHNSIALQFKITSGNIGNLADEFADAYSQAVLEEIRRRVPRHKQTKLEIANVEPFANAAFLSRWFTERQRAEMQYYLNQISLEDDSKIQDVMRIVLSRTVRSCRATTHIDLATLIKPQSEPYYCRKHFKICRPVTTIVRHLERYTEDTIKRIEQFGSLRKNVFCEVINDDSRSIDIFGSIARKNEDFYKILEKKKVDGVFTSPPYVGQIDYHEQHAYAYELFDIERKDNLEIGKQSNGTSRTAQSDYVTGISAVLLNAKKYLKRNAHIFIVANDSKNLYPTIAEKSGLEIVEVFKRPVLNRTERDKQPYSESIFHMISD